jgi:membrane dipeptidase
MALPVFDGHNDVLLEERSFADRSGEGHLDLARARAGGFAGGFFAIFTEHPDGFPLDAERGPDTAPEPAVSHALAKATTDATIEKLLALEAQGALRVVRDPGDLELTGPVRAVMHIEGAEAIEPGLGNLPGLHARGLRSLGITWSRPNAFGHGVPFAAPASPDIGPGLTDAGRALVRACDELGILVDLAHLNARGFWDAAEVTDRPLVVTHACAHALVPSARNLLDEQLDAIGDSGGVVGVCFHHEDVGPHRTDIARQVDHIAHRIGPAHVALGSDFDGCELPEGIAGAEGLQDVLGDLAALGWSEGDIALVASGNWLRVLRNTMQASPARISTVATRSSSVSPSPSTSAPETRPNTGTSSENGATTPGE